MVEGGSLRSATGTGKNRAFGVPLLECLNPGLTDIQAVIVCPTRELCIQIAEEMRQLAAFRPEVRIASIYGGQPIAKQLAALKKNPHIVVATPGRLLDHMNRRTVWLGNVYTAVLDEADEMLKMGFIRDVRRILNATRDVQRHHFPGCDGRRLGIPAQRGGDRGCPQRGTTARRSISTVCCPPAPAACRI